MNRAMELAMSITARGAMQRTVLVVAVMSLDVPAVAMKVTAVSVGVTVDTGMAVPLPMNMVRRFVEIAQCHTDDYADCDSDRQCAAMIRARRRRGQNSNKKQSGQTQTHPVSSFGKPQG